MFKVKGVITETSEVKQLDNGASVVDYTLEVTDGEYKTPFSFSLYKKQEHIQHLTDWIENNSVGDEIEVEFKIKGREYNGKIYNSLTHWGSVTINKVVEQAAEKATESVESDLPF